MIKETRQVKKTEWKDVKRTVTKVKMVEKLVKRTRLVYDDKVVTSQSKRMKRKQKMVMKRVPTDFKGAVTCPCYQSECDCVGKEGCGCCQPSCDCAPQVHYRNVEVLEETMVPVDFAVSKIERVPRLEHYTEKISEPEKYTEEITEREPKVVMVEMEVDVPVLEEVDREVEVATEVSVPVTEDVPTTIEVEKEIQVPVTEFVEVEV